MNTLFIFHIILFVCDGLLPIGLRTIRQGLRKADSGNGVKPWTRLRARVPVCVCAWTCARARVPE